MSQALSGRAKPLSGHTRIVSRSVCRRWAAPSAPGHRVFLLLWLSLVLVCATATTVFAQQAQTVKSDKTVTCNGTEHQLRLVSAETRIEEKQARALAITLTPVGTSNSKVFSLYWIDAPSNLPTHRDDTSGSLGNALISYGNGKTTSGPVVKSFFDEAGCSSDDQQIKAIETLLDANIGRTPAALSDITRAIKNQVEVDETKIDNAAGSSLGLFSGLTNNIGFGRAVRQYASSVSADRRPSKALQGQAKAFTQVEDSLFGGAPLWLTIAFPVTLVLLLISLSIIGMGYLDYLKKRSAPVKPDASDAGAAEVQAADAVKQEAAEAGAQVAQLSAQLGAILNRARERRERIEQRDEVTRKVAGQHQPAVGQDNLARSILRGLESILHVQYHNKAKEIIKRELDKGSPLRAGQQPDVWKEAYTDLQNRLEELKKSLPDGDGKSLELSPPEPPAEPTSEVPQAVQELKATIEQLVTNVGAMKGSVDGFDQTVAKYFQTKQGLQTIGLQWYGPNYSGEKTDALVTEVGQAIDLYHLLSRRCGKAGATLSETKDCLLNTLDSLNVIRETYFNNLPDALPHIIAAKVKIKLADEAEYVNEYKLIKQMLSQAFIDDKRPNEIVQHMMVERSKAREILETYHHEGSFIKNIEAVGANYIAITEEVKRALSGASGSVREMVASLATKFLNLKPVAERAEQMEVERNNLQQELTVARGQLEAGQALAAEIALQLNFKTDRPGEDDQMINGTLNQLKKEREASVYLQLRLGLSSALIAMEKAADPNNSELQEVIEALQLDKVKRGVKKLLVEMEEYSGQQLWDRALSQAFSEKWLHYLIRADLLLRTYYVDLKEFGYLRKSVSLACSAILAALYEFQVEVLEVGLFDELPSSMETEEVYAGLRNLPAVRDKVRMKVQNMQTGCVVVDVTSFPYFVKGVQENRGRASIANPSAWLQH